MENAIKMNDNCWPLFMETSIYLLNSIYLSCLIFSVLSFYPSIFLSFYPSIVTVSIYSITIIAQLLYSNYIPVYIRIYPNCVQFIFYLWLYRPPFVVIYSQDCPKPNLRRARWHPRRVPRFSPSLWVSIMVKNKGDR